MSFVGSPQSIPMQAMNPVEPAKRGYATRTRKGRTVDTLLGHLPQGDRHPTAPPDLDSGLPVLLVRVVGHYPIASRRGRSDPHTGPCGLPVYAVTEEGVAPASTSRYLTGQVKLSSGGGPDQAVTARPSRRVGRSAAGQTAARLHRRRGGCARGRGRRTAGGPSDLPRRPSRPAAPARQRARAPRDLPAPRRAYACHFVREDRRRAGGSPGEPDAPGRRQAGRFVEPAEPPGRHRQHRGAHCRGRGTNCGRRSTVGRRAPMSSCRSTCPTTTRRTGSSTATARPGHTLPGSSPAASSGRGPHAPVPPSTPERRRTRRSSVRPRPVPAHRLPRHLRHGLAIRPENRDISPDRLQPSHRGQFRMFEDDGGVDVVRAMRLDLSGRTLSPGWQGEGERFMAENLVLAARRYYREEPQPPRSRARPPVLGSPGSARMTYGPSSP